MNWYVTSPRKKSVPLADIPSLPYDRFRQEAAELLSNESFHCAHYFGVPDRQGYTFYCLLLNDESGKVWITSWRQETTDAGKCPSLAALHPALHPFEREITEKYGLRFADSPFDKPLRFDHERHDPRSSYNNYPFYSIDSPALHEVNVGPIHAGVIESGAFRFICNGERILHLEIVLGYQHRGLERLLRETSDPLRRCLLIESAAGDSVVSHTLAHCRLIETLTGREPSARLETERTIAQELERIAMHLADTGALCMDVGFQLGQVACEALRTIVINTTQRWCGNRFGRTLIRPGGSRYPLDGPLCAAIVDTVKEVRRRYGAVCEDLFSTPSVLARFEECGKVPRAAMAAIGAVGMAARASGLPRDIRRSHPYGVYADTLVHEPVVLETGDVLARAMMRCKEAMQSIEVILTLLRDLPAEPAAEPDYASPPAPSSLAFSLVEGWRGEVCHLALTDSRGEIAAYKLKDPSLHNWYALSLAVRGAGISDFPVNNKSFNLSYCGHDL
jgi:Ni,Fe-hydrogenase III large subunit